MTHCVEDAMVKDVITIGANEKVSTAIDLMADNCISSLLVMSGDILLGIITEKDIVGRLIKGHFDPNSVEVASIMSKSLVIVEPKTSICDANRLMVEKKIKKLPVVDNSSRKLVGILSITDLVKLQNNILKETNRETLNTSEALLRILLQAGESQGLEFKSTLRWDLHKTCVNPELERVIMKSICAFLNSKGGELIIGVSDKRDVLGLDFDYKTLKNQNRDGFENKLTTLISMMIGDPVLKDIETSFPIMDGKELCRVNITASREPVFLHEAGQETFFVRTGNNSRPFSLSDTVKYIRERWQ